MLRPSRAARRSSFSAESTAAASRAARQACRFATWLLLHLRRDGDDRTLSGRQRRRFGLDELVDADHDALAQLDLIDPA